MSTINDGGPAFPHAQRLWDNDAMSWAVHSVGGMTLRDYFAGQALVGILAAMRYSKPEDAILSYLIADAMIKAREDTQP